MKTHSQGAKNGPRWFVGLMAGLVAIGNVVASPPLANESVAIPKILATTATDTGQKLQAAETSPVANDLASANQQISQFDAANEFCTGAINSSPNTPDKIAGNNNGVTAAVAMSNDKADFNSGSDTAYVAPSATTNPVPIDTSPTATVGRSASANTAQVINTEGGVCSGATLVVNAAADFSVEWTDLGAQATACNA